jgi:hypothetical protein
LFCLFCFGLVFELRCRGWLGVVFSPEMLDLGKREGRALLEACDEAFETVCAVRLGSHGGMVGVTLDWNRRGGAWGDRSKAENDWIVKEEGLEMHKTL